MAMPAHSVVNGIPTRIRRFSGQSTGQTNVAPASVGNALAGPGRPLDSAIRQDMEPRFGHDFSRVRVHSGAAAEQSAQDLNAEAYTVGQDIVFGTGSFTQSDAAGRRLIAHELVHVVQAENAPPVVRRAPALKGHTTAEKVDDNIATVVDKAIAESPTIAKFVPAKKLKAESGHLVVDDPAVFTERYKKYAKEVGATDKPEEVGGFTDRKAGEIHLRFHTADVEAALHEAVHLNSSTKFQGNFGHPCNEGVTEYFTQKVLDEQGLKPGKAYADQMKIAEGLIAALDENQVGNAYFKGDLAAYKAVVKALGNDFSTWHSHINSNDPADWEQATALVKKALGKK
jgi:Domain of unknown function (DUF4157)